MKTLTPTKARRRSDKPRVPVLKDIASLAGCSLAVVSKVINNAKGNTGVSQEMRERVLRVAREINYRPNFAAQSLASRQSNTIGVYIAPKPHSGMSNPFYESVIVGGIERACREHGYDLLLVNLIGQQPLDVCLRKFEEKRIDGLVLVHVHQDAPWLDELHKHTSNVIVVDAAPRPDIDAVVFDNVAAIEQAIDHLIGLGHRSIGFLGHCHSSPMGDTVQRRDAFIEAMKKRADIVAYNPAWLHDVTRLERLVSTEGSYCDEEGYLGAEYLLSLGSSRPTAVIAYNDLVASVASERFQQAGLRLPAEMSVVGIDNSSICNFVRPKLTSVSHPLDEMGYAAAKRLFVRLGADVEGSSSKESCSASLCQRFRPEVVVRGSTCVPEG